MVVCACSKLETQHNGIVSSTQVVRLRNRASFLVVCGFVPLMIGTVRFAVPPFSLTYSSLERKNLLTLRINQSINQSASAISSNIQYRLQVEGAIVQVGAGVALLRGE